MRAMTIGADRGLLGTSGDGMPMNTLLIRSDRLHTQAALDHDQLLAVACPAGCRNVGVVRSRLGIASRQQFMRAAVAVYACGRICIPLSCGSGMQAAIVDGLLVRVTFGAANSLRRCVVHSARYIRVAIHAGEQAAVNGILERLGINMKADGLAAHLMR